MHKLKTKIWKVDNFINGNNQEIIEIAEQLRLGKVIALPTETVYGLGANALDTDAVKNIFKAKGRPSDNPLIVHIANIEQLNPLVTDIDEKSKKLIDHFWPGPLTIIFKRKEGISELVSAGLPTVAIRMPDHPVALAIIKAANLPIAAPSANRSGKPSPTKAEHVINDLDGLIDGIVDSGNTGVGVESTVIDVSGKTPTVLRPGGVTIEELKEVLGNIKLDPAIFLEGNKPLSPGMKYKHYSPNGEMLIVQGEENRVIEKINEISKEKSAQGKKVGILTIKDHKNLFTNAEFIQAYGNKKNLYPLAEHFYDSLRQFDIKNIDYILAEAVVEQGIGLTIMNRLKKAADGNIISV